MGDSVVGYLRPMEGALPVRYGTLAKTSREFTDEGRRVASFKDIFLRTYGMDEKNFATSETWVYDRKKVFLSRAPLTIEELEDAEFLNGIGREFFPREETLKRLFSDCEETGFIGYVQTREFGSSFTRYLLEDSAGDVGKFLREQGISTMFVHLHNDISYDRPFVRPFTFFSSDTTPLVFGNGSFNQPKKVAGTQVLNC